MFTPGDFRASKQNVIVSCHLFSCPACWFIFTPWDLYFHVLHFHPLPFRWSAMGASRHGQGVLAPPPMEMLKSVFAANVVWNLSRCSIYASFWENVVTLIGELPIDPTGGLTTSDPLIAHPWKKSCGRPGGPTFSCRMILIVRHFQSPPAKFGWLLSSCPDHSLIYERVSCFLFGWEASGINLKLHESAAPWHMPHPALPMWRPWTWAKCPAEDSPGYTLFLNEINTAVSRRHYNRFFFK